MLRLLIATLVVTSTALADGKPAPHPGKANGPACRRHLLEMNRCKQEYCEMNAEVAAGLAEGGVPPDQRASLIAQLKDVCVRSVEAPAQGDAAMERGCAQFNRSPQALRRTFDQCEAKASDCSAWAACLKPRVTRVASDAARKESPRK